MSVFTFISIITLMQRALTSQAQVVLDRYIMDLTVTAGKVIRSFRDPNASAPLFEEFSFWGTRSDAAVVVKQNGYCYGAFRGTDFSSPRDVFYSVKARKRVFCVDLECCRARLGLWQAYFRLPFREQFETTLSSCVNRTCGGGGGGGNTSCLILAGHSKGASVAALASAYWKKYNPTVITTGMEPVLDYPCPLINSSNWYRWVNTIILNETTEKLYYDLVPFLPEQPLTQQFGHFLLLSDDPSGLAYLGLDANDKFFPRTFQAHAMRTADHIGYFDKIDALMKYIADHSPNVSYPIRTTGFSDGYLCTKDKECASRYCAKPSPMATGVCTSP